MQKKSIFEGIGLSAIVFAIISVIALPLRTLQYFNNIEPSSGFFSENNLTVWIFWGLCALITAASVAIAFIKRGSLSLDFTHEKRPGCGIVSALLAVLTLADALRCFDHTFNLGLDFIPQPQYPDFVEPLRMNIILGVIRVEGITAVLAAVFFIVSALAFLSGKSVAEKPRILSLTPVIWCVLRIVYRFSITISYLRVSQLSVEMFMLIFSILFFMSYAQVNSKVNAKGLDWKIPGYGFPAAFFALLSFVPQIIVILSKRSDLLYMYSTVYFCDFGIALFILGIILTRMKAAVNQPEEATQTAQEIAEETQEKSEETKETDK